jgi:hypothetical protein
VRSSVTLVSLPLETLLITRRQYNTQGYPVRELGLASRYANPLVPPRLLLPTSCSSAHSAAPTAITIVKAVAICEPCSYRWPKHPVETGLYSPNRREKLSEKPRLVPS